LLDSYKRLAELEAWKDILRRLERQEDKIVSGWSGTPAADAIVVKYLRYFRKIPEFAVRRLATIVRAANEQHERGSRG